MNCTSVSEIIHTWEELEKIKQRNASIVRFINYNLEAQEWIQGIMNDLGMLFFDVYNMDIYPDLQGYRMCHRVRISIKIQSHVFHGDFILEDLTRSWYNTYWCEVHQLKVKFLRC